MLLSYSVARTISRPDRVDHRVIRLPRASLGPLLRNIDDAVLCRIPRGTGMLSLLGSYVDAVFDDPALARAQHLQALTVDRMLPAVVGGPVHPEGAACVGDRCARCELEQLQAVAEQHVILRHATRLLCLAVKE